MANKNEAKIRFTAETGEFNDKISRSNDEMAKLRAELKFNNEQMKTTGTTVEGLEKNHKILSDQLEASKSKTEALSQKVKKAKEIYGENSSEVNKLQIQLINAQTAEEKLSRAVDKANDELQSQKKVSNETESATEKLTNEIGDQEKKLSDLKDEYTEAVLQHGKLSKTARNLGKQIDMLSDELKDNKEKLSSAEKEADKFDNTLDDVTESSDEAGISLKEIGGKVAGIVATGFATMAAGATALVGSFLASAESTREYREDMGKLQTAFQSAGLTTEQATETYKGFFAVLGEEDRSVEAVSHLAQLTSSQQELDMWTNICAGVWGTFGDSLPIEGLTEASNETAKTGQLTGVLADALNWAGVSEEEFQKKLEGLNTEEERATFITETLNGLYSEASEKYKELNGDIMDAQRAQSELNDAMANIGASAEPVMTSIKLIGAGILTDLIPSVELIGEGLSGVLSGTEGSAGVLADGIGGALESVVDKIGNALPVISQTLGELFPALITLINENAPMLLSTVISLIFNLLSSLSGQLPSIVSTLVVLVSNLLTELGSQLPTILPILVTGILDAIIALFENADQLIDGAIAFIEGLVQGILIALPILIEKLPIITEAIFDALLDGDASLIAMIQQLIPQIVIALIQMTPDLLIAIGQILGSTGVYLWERLKMFYENFKAFIVPIALWLYDNVLVPIGKFFANLWESVVDGLKVAWQWMVGIFNTATSWIYNSVIQPVVKFFVDLWEGLKQGASDVWEGIKEIFALISGWINENVVQPVATFFVGLWTGIKQGVTDARDTIKETFLNMKQWLDTNIVVPIAEFFQGMWSKMKTGASNAWSGIKSVFSTVGSFFKTTFTNAWQGVKDIFSTGGRIFDGIKEGISNVFTNIVNKIIGGINKVMSSAFGGLNTALKKLKNLTILEIKPFTWIKTVTVPSIPLMAEGGILTKPTLNIAGEAGPEAIIPIDKLETYISGAIDRSLQAINIQALANAVEDLANRAIELNINGQKFAVATAGDTDRVNGDRIALSRRGLAL